MEHHFQQQQPHQAPGMGARTVEAAWCVHRGQCLVQADTHGSSSYEAAKPAAQCSYVRGLKSVVRCYMNWFPSSWTFFQPDCLDFLTVSLYSPIIPSINSPLKLASLVLLYETKNLKR